MFFDFIEIGTSDFDTEIQKKDNKIGISIDAVKYYIDKLPNKNGCTKINSGISNFNGEITINYLSVENIKKYKLPNWVRGCNSVNNYHPTVTNLLLKKGIQIKDIINSYKVPCKTLKYLLSDHNINGFYLLKIDTEGHDCIILKHFFNNYNNNSYLPHKIIFESNILTKKIDTENIINLSKQIGYDLISTGDDTILKLNLNKIQKTFNYSNKISYYYIENYSNDYDTNNLPYENTLESAKKYCIKYKCTGITYKNGIYHVCNGNYIYFHNNPNLSCWILF